MTLGPLGIRVAKTITSERWLEGENSIALRFGTLGGTYLNQRVLCELPFNTSMLKPRQKSEERFNGW